MNAVQQFEQSQLEGRDLSLINFRPGETVKVHLRIKEGDKERVQVFQGLVIARRRAGLRSTLTVRKMSGGIGVERIIPVFAPTVEKIEMLRRGRVRRSKLYYIRNLTGKAARLREVRIFN